MTGTSSSNTGKKGRKIPTNKSAIRGRDSNTKKSGSSTSILLGKEVDLTKDDDDDEQSTKDILRQLQERIRDLEGQLLSTKSILRTIRLGGSLESSWRRIGSSSSSRSREEEVDDQDDDRSGTQSAVIRSGHINHQSSRPSNNEEGRDEQDDDDRPSFKLSPDLFSIIATSEMKSFPFFCSLFLICWFQVTPLVLLSFSNLTPNFDATGLGKKMANASPEVRFVSVAIIYALFVIVPDFVVGFVTLKTGLPTHVRGAGRFCKINSVQWKFASVLKAFQGFLNITIAIGLMASSGNVLDVLLNALGIVFISDLDDLFFRRAAEGYLGYRMKKITREIEEADFHNEKSNAIRGSDGGVAGALLMVFIVSLFLALAPLV